MASIMCMSHVHIQQRCFFYCTAGQWCKFSPRQSTNKNLAEQRLAPLILLFDSTPVSRWRRTFSIDKFQLQQLGCSEISFHEDCNTSHYLPFLQNRSNKKVHPGLRMMSFLTGSYSIFYCWFWGVGKEQMVIPCIPEMVQRHDSTRISCMSPNRGKSRLVKKNDRLWGMKPVLLGHSEGPLSLSLYLYFPKYVYI